jgi:hypothetical protein
MRSKLFLMLALVVALATSAAAKTKTSGTVSCAKPSPSYSIPVSDHAGHALSISQSACTWTKAMEIEGLKTTAGLDVSYGDAMGTEAHTWGYHVSTMSNGDKMYVKFQGKDTMTKDGKPVSTEGTWSYTGGTGKLKGIKGGGTYKGKADATGNYVVEVEGTYEITPSMK